MYYLPSNCPLSYYIKKKDKSDTSHDQQLTTQESNEAY